MDRVYRVTHNNPQNTRLTGAMVSMNEYPSTSARIFHTLERAQDWVQEQRDAYYDRLACDIYQGASSDEDRAPVPLFAIDKVDINRVV